MSHSTSRFNPVSPRSRFYQGPFGRLFPELPPWSPTLTPGDSLETHFLKFAGRMKEEPDKTASNIAKNEELRKRLDGDFNSEIPAGYTYFGQFVDHDLTHDVTPLSQTEVDPERIRNFRTPRLDLDCVYGQGHVDQPFLYEHGEDGFTGKLLVGEQIPNTDFPDLPRNTQGRALIGDMRNDENAIVAQMHLAFVLAHNKLVDQATKMNRGPDKDRSAAFGQARRTLCWLYQWIVWNDFLRRITDEAIHAEALQLVSLVNDSQTIGAAWLLGFQEIFNWQDQPFMPVEFSGAAYRFGHSMVRNSYQTNSSSDAGFRIFIPLFDGSGNTDDLRGFRPLDKRRLVQWDWFLEMGNLLEEFPQRARKIDTKLSNALAELPPEDPEKSDSIMNVLAARNLIRGVRLQLPSGPDVARKLGLEPIPLGEEEPLSLWYYILKEAEESDDGRLGPLGSIILCSVFAGFLKGDPTSWVNVEPTWTPDQDPLLTDKDGNFKKDGENGAWTLASIIRLSGLPVSGDDIQNGSSQSGYPGGGGGGGGVNKGRGIFHNEISDSARPWT